MDELLLPSALANVGVKVSEAEVLLPVLLGAELFGTPEYEVLSGALSDVGGRLLTAVGGARTDPTSAKAIAGTQQAALAAVATFARELPSLPGQAELHGRLTAARKALMELSRADGTA